MILMNLSLKNQTDEFNILRQMVSHTGDLSWFLVTLSSAIDKNLKTRIVVEEPKTYQLLMDEMNGQIEDVVFHIDDKMFNTNKLKIEQGKDDIDEESVTFSATVYFIKSNGEMVEVELPLMNKYTVTENREVSSAFRYYVWYDESQCGCISITCNNLKK